MCSTAIVALTGLVVAAAGMDAVQAAAAGPTVRLLVINRANVQADILEAAEDDAATIYRAAGVQMTWCKAGADGFARDRNEIAVMLVSGRGNPYLAARVERAAMGFVSSTSMGDAGRDRTAYALYDRVEENAGSHHRSVSRLLGEVIAHEVGHVLLPSGHSDRGIMQAVWDLRSGMLEYFTSAQAETIRRRLTLRSDETLGRREPPETVC
jgi:hypothetical protein